jgi:hypothetical protein
MHSVTPFTSPPKPVCRLCHKPMSTDPFLGRAEKDGGYTCPLCYSQQYITACDAHEAARDRRQGKFNCILAACITIVAFTVGVAGMGMGYFTAPSVQPAPLTAEERITADRLATIDAQMGKLQDERDEIDPPQDYERDGPYSF